MLSQSSQKDQVLSPPYSDLQVTTKFHLRGTQNFRQVFTEKVQVTVVCHVSGWAHILSDLQETTGFYLLDRPYSWLTTTGGRTKTGSMAAGVVNLSLYVASFVSIYRVLTPPTLAC